MQTEGLGLSANAHAALRISIHLIFVVQHYVEESIFGCRTAKKMPFLFLRRLQFSSGDMKIQM